jgi:hypothetical protein
MKKTKLINLISQSNYIKLSSLYDNAIIGFENKSKKCIYSVKKIITIIKKNNNLWNIEAIDYYFDNIYKDSNKAPIFLEDFNYDNI